MYAGDMHGKDKEESAGSGPSATGEETKDSRTLIVNQRVS